MLPGLCRIRTRPDVVSLVAVAAFGPFIDEACEIVGGRLADSAFVLVIGCAAHEAFWRRVADVSEARVVQFPRLVTARPRLEAVWRPNRRPLW